MTPPARLFQPPRTAAFLAPYWEGVRAHELRLPRCSVCGRWEWYPVAGGPACAGADYRWQAIKPAAVVFTFTWVQRPLLPSVTDPYCTGLVVADEAPACRIPAQIVGERGNIRIGARARLAFHGEGDDAFPYFVVEAAR